MNINSTMKRVCIAIACVSLLTIAAPSVFWGFVAVSTNINASKSIGPYARKIRTEVKKNIVGKKWGERVSIDPRLITKSQTRQDAEENLLSNKFKKMKNPFLQKDQSLAPGTEVFGLYIGGFPCNTFMQVYVVYTDQKVLYETSGAIFEAGCL